MNVLLIFLAIVLFGILAFKGVNALVLAPLVTTLLLICSGMPVLENLLTNFMPAAADYISNYFLVFFVGAIFGAIYKYTGAAESVALTLSKASKGKRTAGIVMTITGILTFGGVSGFVVFFVIYPVAVRMFKESNLSRRLLPAAISAGCWTWSMSGPGSPSIQNVIAMRYLGTPSTAAFLPSLISAIVMYIMIFVWLEYRSKKLTEQGKTFHDSSLKYQLDLKEYESSNDEDLPNPVLSFIPMIAILVAYNIGPLLSAFGIEGISIPVEYAVLIGIGLSVLFFWKRIPGLNQWVQIINEGATDSGSSIMNTAIVVGFGGVVQNTQGFSTLVESLKGLNMNPLIFVMLTVAVCAGACGSASGGMGVAFNALKDTYVSMGVNLEYVHRIAAIAAGTLDTLPHQGAQITLLNICKLTHGEAYYDMAITQILIPFIDCFIFIGLVSLGL